MADVRRSPSSFYLSDAWLLGEKRNKVGQVRRESLFRFSGFSSILLIVAKKTERKILPKSSRSVDADS